MLAREKINATRANIRRRIIIQSDHDNLKNFAFKISVNGAIRYRGDEARPVIIAELK
jgi:hypothetical protein